MHLQESIELVWQLIEERHQDDEYVIDEENIFDAGFAWYIPFQYKDQSKRGKLLRVGAYPGYIVDKATSEYMQPGSAYTIEKWLAGFEIGLRGKVYDLHITQVNNLSKSIEVLLDIDLTYYIPEWEAGIEWKIPKRFTSEMIREKLLNLPCTFRNQGLTFRIEQFKFILDNNLFQYQLLVSDETSSAGGERIG